MIRTMLQPIRLFYLLRPDFFHHNHIHARKIQALQERGLNATMLSFVSPSQFARHTAEYNSAHLQYNVTVKRLPGSRRLARQTIRLFFIRQLLSHRRVVVQCLLGDVRPLLPILNSPWIRNRFKLIMEYEGDSPSEFVYIATHSDSTGPTEEPPAELLAEYRNKLKKQRDEIESASLVVVGAEEHRVLLEHRLGRDINYCVLPPLFDPSVCRYSATHRSQMRATLGLDDREVLLHLGGTTNPWHRFQDICAFVSDLAKVRPKIHLLGVIRPHDMADARAKAEANNILDRTTLLSAKPQDVGAYLSAADFGLFIRHHHTMTRVVTSAKLGEYLAAGLPLISTGAHALFGPFIDRAGLKVAINESLDITTDFLDRIRQLELRGSDCAFRENVGRDLEAEYCGNRDPVWRYVDKCVQLFDHSESDVN